MGYLASGFELIAIFDEDQQNSFYGTKADKERYECSSLHLIRF